MAEYLRKTGVRLLW